MNQQTPDTGLFLHKKALKTAIFFFCFGIFRLFPTRSARAINQSITNLSQEIATGIFSKHELKPH